MKENSMKNYGQNYKLKIKEEGVPSDC